MSQLPRSLAAALTPSLSLHCAPMSRRSAPLLTQIPMIPFTIGTFLPKSMLPPTHVELMLPQMPGRNLLPKR
jgi:hypothetical protein